MFKGLLGGYFGFFNPINRVGYR